MPAPTPADFSRLAGKLEGELQTGRTARLLYATDASEYQELPAAVALPRTEADVRALLAFAREHRLGIIPRTAGTSLAGQVVGSGLVVDLGRHLNRIVSIDVPGRRVRVQPGVVRNELNLALDSIIYRYGATGKERESNISESYRHILALSPSLVHRYFLWAAKHGTHLFDLDAELPHE